MTGKTRTGFEFYAWNSADGEIYSKKFPLTYRVSLLKSKVSTTTIDVIVQPTLRILDMWPEVFTVPNVHYKQNVCTSYVHDIVCELYEHIY
jgi:hypothetical protein